MIANTSVTGLLLAVVFGAAFGWLLHRGRVTSYNVIVNQLRLKDFTVLKVMLTAIVVGGLGVLLFVNLGLANWSIRDANMLAVLIGGSDYRQYEVPADRELHEMLIEQEAAFWARVQSGEPPEPVNAADAARLWGRASREQRVVATDAVAEAVARLRALKLRRAEMDAEEESARLAVMQALGEADTLVGVDGSVLCTWRAAKPAQRLDGAALKAARPDIYTQFLRAGEPSRRMLIK